MTRRILAILCGLMGAALPPLDAQEPVAIALPDSGTLQADLYGAGRNAVVLVAHGGYSYKARWERQARILADAGFRVLAFETRAALLLRAGTETACLYEASCMAPEVLAAVRYLRHGGATTVSVVGGSAGGGAVAQASIDAVPGEIDRIILLAPMSIATPERMTGKKLFLTSRGDRSDAGPRLPAIREQYERAPKPKKLVILEGSAHGQLMFDAPEGERLLREILNFLPVADPVPAHDSFTVESRALGEARRVNVYTPPRYRAALPTRRAPLPVLYMPDGGLDEDFPHVASTVDSLIALGAIRPVIVVGIPNTQRRRDLSSPTRVATDSAMAPEVGGSGAFRRFIGQELMPEIERRYRTTPERAVIGESLAGLFVVETFLEEPALFTHYVALDPSVWWNSGALMDSAEVRLRAGSPAPRTLYLASSSVADIAAGTARLATVLRAAPPRGLRWRYEPRPDLTHATIFRALKATALVDALSAPRFEEETIRPPPARAALDHLILGISSLENGIKAFAELSGIVPVRGGAHPGAGTENALVSLGEGAYLELIAPRPGATPTSFAIISSLQRLTPIGWALHADNLSALVEELRKAEPVLGPFPGSRQTPDGKLLTWKTAHLAAPGLEDAPFLIEWGQGSVHPSSTSPSGCRLAKLTVAEPAPARLNAFLRFLGVDLVAQASPNRRLAFTLRCPRGEITFTN